MKKILLTILICFASAVNANVAWAQKEGTYTLSFEFLWMQNYGHDMNNIHFVLNVETPDESKTHIDHWFERMDNGWNAWNLGNNLWKQEYSTTSSLLWKVHFNSTRYWKPWGSKTKNSYQYGYNSILGITSLSGKTLTGTHIGGEIIHVCNTTLKYTFLPTEIKLYDYYNEEIKGTIDWPDVDYVTIKATKGFTTKLAGLDAFTGLYEWQYSTDGEHWYYMGQKSSNNEIRIRGIDVFPYGTDFMDLIKSGKVVQIRINTPTQELLDRRKTDPNAEIKAITLQPMLSAPHIVDAKVEKLESRYGSSDAEVKITFDRALYAGEILYIKRSSRIYESTGEPLSLDSNNSAIIRNVVAGKDTLSVSSALGGAKIYTAAPTHSRAIDVPHRPKINHAISGTRSVSCRDGIDGQITVTATGGNDDFIAKLYKAGDNTEIAQTTFSTGTSSVFSGLSAGNYEVTVFDTNGGGSENNTNVTADVIQPAEPVAVEIEHLDNPKGYDTRDGEVTLRVSGGTLNAGGGYDVVRVTHDSGYTYAMPYGADDNGDVLYTFESLVRGNYYVTVQDKNYAIVDPSYTVTPCRCEAVLEFLLTAPPPIVLDVTETHFVNWFGGNQGELTANVTGGNPFTTGLPYTFKWYKNEGGIIQQLNIANSNVAKNLTAGTYHVEVTDASGVTATSSAYELTEPEAIVVQFAVAQTGCSGENSGSIEAIVSGGVPEYKYQWNVEGAAENKLTSLEAGVYMLKVTDARGGIKTSAVEVESSSDLKVESVVVQPTCRAMGSIKLRLSGATPPYSLKWNDLAGAIDANPDTDYTRDELIPGQYTVEITDGNGCRNVRRFTIEEVEGLTVDLGGDLVMCRNQSRLIEAACDKPNLTYEWYFNDTKLPDSGRTLLVDKAGTYRVEISNSDGCSASDEINVAITGDVLELAMTVPTTIEVSSPTNAVNLSTMQADRIEWILPQEAVVSERTDTRLVFQIDKVGTYTVSMEGFKGAGSSIVTRDIEVVGKGKVDLPNAPLIKQFWATPNPSTGYFKVVVELDRADDFSLLLYSPSGILMDTKEEKSSTGKTFEYEISGSMQGTYLLHLMTKSDKSVLKIVIGK